MNENTSISHIHIVGKYNAWSHADLITGNNIRLDINASKTAGYPIYRSLSDFCTYVCELGDHYEVNLSDGRTVNIWIDPVKVKVYKVSH